MSPNPIQLNAHGSEIVFNNLYDTPTDDWLDEDLVFIRLLDGSKVEAGWYADPDSEGHFKIVRYKATWNDPIDVFRVKSVHDLVKCLEAIAERASQPAIQPIPTPTEYHSII